MAGPAECALPVTHDQMPLFRIQRVVAGEATDLAIGEDHLGTGPDVFIPPVGGNVQVVAHTQGVFAFE